MTKKEIITKAILSQIPEGQNIYLNHPLEKVIFEWWFTGRSGGLRLTDSGDTAFTLANIEYSKCPYKTKRSSWYQFLLECDRKIHCPYYLGVNKESGKNVPYIKLYDTKIAMMINLYGDLEDYLKTAKVRK